MRADRSMGGVATMERPAAAKSRPAKAAQSQTPTTEMTRETRARLVIESLGQPSLTRFAHENGILLTTLSNWRGMARDGHLEVPPRVRAALKAEMPVRTFRRSGSRRKAQVSLTNEAAARAVLDSIRSGKSLPAVAEAHRISDSQLHQLRARARDGLIEIPMVDRALLTSRITPRGGAAEAAPAQAFKAEPTPAAKPAKRGKAAAKSAAKSRRKNAPKAKATVSKSSAGIEAVVLRKNGATIEIPTTLSASKMAAILSAALAA